MSDQNDQLDAVEAARREGFEQARLRGRKQLVVGLLILMTLLGSTVVAGITFAQRAEEAAPRVIAEIATERQADFERRLIARTAEAHKLTVQLFDFLENLWVHTEALHVIRSNVDGAQQQLGLLSLEVQTALDSPANVGRLLENGPTRAKAVFQHLAAVAKEVQRFVPAVLSALKKAQTAAEAVADDESSLTVVLTSLDALLAPFLGTHIDLQAEWANLKGELLAWMEHVDADFTSAREQLSGESLSDEFMKRLAERVF